MRVEQIRSGINLDHAIQGSGNPDRLDRAKLRVPALGVKLQMWCAPCTTNKMRCHGRLKIQARARGVDFWLL